MFFVDLLLFLLVFFVAGVYLPLWESKVYTFFKGGDQVLKSPNIFETLRLVRSTSRIERLTGHPTGIFLAIILCTVFLAAFSPRMSVLVHDTVFSQNPAYLQRFYRPGFDWSPSFFFYQQLEPVISGGQGLVAGVAYLAVCFVMFHRLPRIHENIDYGEGRFVFNSEISGLGYIFYGVFVFTLCSIFTVVFFGVPLDPRFPGLLLIHLIIAFSPKAIESSIYSVALKRGS